MRYPMLLQTGLLALTLGSIQVQADERYPAADFEPKVLYQAQEIVSSQPLAEERVGTEYPAAHFTPRVVFQDLKLIEQTGPVVQAAPLAPAAPAQSAKPVQNPDNRTGPIADVSPPIGALGIAVAVIALAFFWFARKEKAKAAEEKSNPVGEEQPIEPSQKASETEVLGGDIEELAAEVEQTLATTNRQRAGKTKRTRRR